jgi:hypothetical protein
MQQYALCWDCVCGYFLLRPYNSDAVVRSHLLHCTGLKTLYIDRLKCSDIIKMYSTNKVSSNLFPVCGIAQTFLLILFTVLFAMHRESVGVTLHMYCRKVLERLLLIPLSRWFPKCGPRVPRDPRPLPRGSVDKFL